MENNKSDSSFCVKMRQKMIVLMKQMEIYLQHGPSHQKFALANEIRNKELEIIEHIVRVEILYHNKTALTNLNIAHEQLRALIALWYEFGYFDYKKGKMCENAESLTPTTKDGFKKFTYINLMVNQIGKMIGVLLSNSVNK